MTINSPVAKIFLLIFAAIGAVAVLGFVGMLVMHGSMMSMMGSPTEMAAACQGMMAKFSP